MGTIQEESTSSMGSNKATGLLYLMSAGALLLNMLKMEQLMMDMSWLVELELRVVLCLDITSSGVLITNVKRIQEEHGDPLQLQLTLMVKGFTAEWIASKRVNQEKDIMPLTLLQSMYL